MVSSLSSHRAFFASICTLAGSALRASLFAVVAICLAFCPRAMAQTAHFSGAQIAVANSGFTAPGSIAVNSSGTVFVVDSGAVYEIPYSAGVYGTRSAIGSFTGAQCVAVDSSDNLFIADPSGVYESAYSGGTYGTPALLPGSPTSIDPVGLAVDASKNVFVADQASMYIYEITFASGYATATAVVVNGLPIGRGLAVDSSDNLFFGDPGGIVYEALYSAGSWGSPISVVTTDTLSLMQIALDASGNLFVADSDNNAIKEYFVSGGYATGTTVSSLYNAPAGVAVDASGNVYIADTGNAAIDKVIPANLSFGTVGVGVTSSALKLLFTFDTAGSISDPAVLTQGAAGLDFANAGSGSCTAAGSPYSANQTCTVNVTLAPTKPGLRLGAVEILGTSSNVLATGYVSGTGSGPEITFLPATESNIIAGTSLPEGLATDASGNLYVADDIAHKVFQISGGNTYTAMDLMATGSTPKSVAVDGAGNIYAADSINDKIWKVAPGSTANTFGTPVVLTSGVNYPRGVAVDGGGNVYIANAGASNILKMSPSISGYTAPSPVTITGATLSAPFGIAVDGSGSLYIADFGASAVVIQPPSGSAITLSGVGQPYSVAVDPNGNVYLASSDGTIKELPRTGSTSWGAATTVSTSSLTAPFGVALDGSGNLYLSDNTANKIYVESYATAPTLNFGSGTFAGQADATTQTATVVNFGNTTLQLSGLTAPTDFALAGGSCTSSTALAAAGNCTLTLEFLPLTVNTFSELYTLTDNNLNVAAAPQSITLSGTSVQSNTSTVVGSSLSPSTVNAAVSFTATVSPSSYSGSSAAGFTGTVNFQNNGTSITGCSAQTVTSAGVATCTISNLAAGTYSSIVAVYSGDSNFITSTSANLQQVVNAVTPVVAVSLTAGSSPSTVNGSVTFTATVTPTGTPTVAPNAADTVTFKSDGTTICSNALVSVVGTTATATCTTTALTGSASGHSIVAYFSGDSNYNTADNSGSPLTQVVNKATSSTGVTTSGSPSTVNGTVTLTATVTPFNSSVALSTGTMAFLDNGVAISSCTAQPVTYGTGVATCTVMNLAAGTHPITATYSGDPSYSNSTSVSTSQVVNKATSSTGVTTSGSPSTVNGTVTFTATVSPSNSSVALSTGTMAFLDNGVAISSCTAQPVTYGTGVATCTVTNLAAGSHPITATYSNDPSYSNSTSASTSQVVNKATTTSTVASGSTANTSTVGDSVTFTATVSTTGTPSVSAGGTVNFTLDGAALCTAASTTMQANNTLTATCAAPALTASAGHSIVAIYSGDSNYNGSTSSTLTQIVNKATSTVAVASSTGNASTVNGSVTFTATVSPSNSVVALSTGTVAFLDNGVAISSCTAQPVTYGTGVATCTVTNLKAATHPITATYSGDPNFSNGTSSLISQVVSQATATTVVASSSAANTSTVDDSVTFTATVSPHSGSVLLSTGTMAFLDNGAAISACTSQTVDYGTGLATCTVTNLTAGTHPITAVYSNDPNYSTSTSAAISQTVSQALTSAIVTTSGSPSPLNGSVTFTATVKAPTGAAVPLSANTVSFTDNSTGIAACTSMQVSMSAGNTVATASCTTSTLIAGRHTIVANYQSDSNYNITNPSLAQEVSKATSTTVLSLSDNTSTVNQAVTLTATVTPIGQPVSLNGTVTFMDSSSAVAGCSVDWSTTTGIARCTIASLSFGTHSLTAMYSADSSYTSSNSTTLPLTVSQANSSLALVSSVPTSSVGQSVTFKATITPIPAGSTQLSGSVTFTDSVTGIAIPGCDAIPLSVTGGVTSASCANISNLAQGVHTITAAYSGDTNFTGNSSTVSQTVNAATTTVAFTVAPTISTVNTPQTFSTTVSGAFGGSIAGTMTFSATFSTGSLTLCSGASINKDTGSASCTTSQLPAGTYSVTASYSGNGSFQPSNQSTPITVSKAVSTLVLTSSQNPSFAYNSKNYQDAPTFTAKILPAPSSGQLDPSELTGAGTTPGTVAFTDVTTGNVLCSASQLTTINNAIIATCSPTPSLTLPLYGSGVNTIQAVYSGDSNFYMYDTNSNNSNLTQLVEDFGLAAPTTSPVTVSQGYTTSTDLFTPQTITLTPLTVQGFSGTLNLTCAVTATTTGSNPTKPNCLLFQNGASTTTLAVVSAGVQSSVSLVIDATNNAGPGIYSVQVTGTDPVSSLTHTTQAFNVTVRATSTGNSITSGATSGNTVTSTFVLPAGVGITGFTCPLIAGTGITTAGGVDPKTLYITCSFNPTSIAATSTVQTVSVSVTISTVSGTKAALAKPPSFLFAGLFGIPAFALLGLLRGRKSTRSAILRLMAILVICAAALQVVGCSGSFTNSNTTGTNLSTPPGTYYLQVQGTGTDGNKYQSVIQLNVTL